MALAPARPSPGVRPTTGPPPGGPRAPAPSPRVAVVLVACLALYAAFGKGFAYAGYPPLFVGEVLLAVLLLAMVRGPMAVPRRAAAVLAAALAGLAVVQVGVDRLVGATPLLETLRGLAPVYYSAFAFAVYALLRRHERRTEAATTLRNLERAMVRLAPLVLGPLVLLALLLVFAPGGLIPWPGSGAPVLLSKPTDIAVTLVLLFPLLTAPRPAPRASAASGSGSSGKATDGRARRDAARTPLVSRSRGWRQVLLVLWFAAAVLVTFRSRGALGALLVGMVAVRPHPVRLLRGIFAATALMLVLYVSGASLTVAQREVSARSAVDSVVSLLGSPDDDELGGNYVATKTWRTEWWGEIWDDVVEKRMLLHGSGWGDNLAVRYGVVPDDKADDPRVLRLPHNVFFSLAGRAGLVTAIGFLAVLVLTLVSSFRGAARSPAVEAARGAVAAAPVAALSDIYLESPQGGILIWSLMGFLWWATVARAREATPGRAARGERPWQPRASTSSASASTPSRWTRPSTPSQAGSGGDSTTTSASPASTG